MSSSEETQRSFIDFPFCSLLEVETVEWSWSGLTLPIYKTSKAAPKAAYTIGGGKLGIKIKSSICKNSCIIILFFSFSKLNRNDQ